MAEQGTMELLLVELARLLEPLAEAAQQTPQPQGIIELAADAGLRLDDILVAPGDLVGFASAFGTAYAALRPVVQRGSIPDPSELPKYLSVLGEVLRRVRDLDDLQVRDDVMDDLPQVGLRLLELLAVEYLSRHRRAAYHGLLALGLIEEGDRKLGVPPRLRLAELPDVVGDPAGFLATEYGWGTDAFASYRLISRLQALGWYLGVPAVFHYPDDATATATGTDPLRSDPDFQLRIPVAVVDRGSGRAQVGLALLPLPAGPTGGPGLALVPFGAGGITETMTLADGWLLVVDTSADVASGYGLVLRPGAAALASLGDDAPPAQLSSSLALVRTTTSTGTRALLGTSDGTRLEVGSAGLNVGFRYAEDATFFVEFPIRRARIVVDPGPADGFLRSVLPAEGLEVEFELLLRWSTEDGLTLGGGLGLETEITVGLDVLGVLTVDRVRVGVQAQESGLRGEVSTTVSVRLGPVLVVVERLGVEATLSFPPDGGNLGLAQVEVAFKPPSGAGVVIDAGIVAGGGYLYFDVDKQQYAGVVHLELARTLNVTAVGLLTTRMPAGSAGFSLLVLVAATFSPPVQLGYGFTLNGVGGLIGVNRTVAVDPLRAGLRAGSLGSVLFPADPVRNAPQILSDLSAIFPPASGRFLVGPMVQLGWGTPTLLTVDLGLVLELPQPVRLLILGRLRVTLPTPQAPVVRLQLDAVGLVDLGSGDVALDAVLYDSRVAAFTVTGAMALRANFGAHPDMVLAVGGFNPRYRPPPGFPSLDPVTISLASGDNPRLRLQAYLAVTSNTVQFGALLELFAKAGPFSIAGHLGLDVLVQLAPFGFVADLAAALALKYNGKSVMSVGLQMTLSGPTPWHAHGTASYKVLFFSGSVDFDVRIGASGQPALPPPVDVRPLLLQALHDLDSWSTDLPAGAHPVVSLRERIGGADRLVHPLSDLRLTQKIAPLGRQISRFGSARPAQEVVFTLGVVDPDGTVRRTEAQGVRAVTEMFAPGQFRDMADEEKLTAPAFEPMQAGISVVAPGFTCGSPVTEPDIVYARETIHRAPPSTAGADPAGDHARTDEASTGRDADGAGLRKVRPAPGKRPGAGRTRKLRRGTVVVGEDVRLGAAFVRQVAGTGSAARASDARTSDVVARPTAPVVVLRPPVFVVVRGRGPRAVVEHRPRRPDGPRPGRATSRPAYTEVVDTVRSRLDRGGVRGGLHVVPVYGEEP